MFIFHDYSYIYLLFLYKVYHSFIIAFIYQIHTRLAIIELLHNVAMLLQNYSIIHACSYGNYATIIMHYCLEIMWILTIKYVGKLGYYVVITLDVCLYWAGWSHTFSLQPCAYDSYYGISQCEMASWVIFLSHVCIYSFISFNMSYIIMSFEYNQYSL